MWAAVLPLPYFPPNLVLNNPTNSNSISTAFSYRLKPDGYRIDKKFVKANFKPAVCARCSSATHGGSSSSAGGEDPPQQDQEPQDQQNEGFWKKWWRENSAEISSVLAELGFWSVLIYVLIDWDNPASFANILSCLGVIVNMGKKKGKEEDPTWQHCARVSDTNRMQLRCNYCGQMYWGGVNRMKNHLAGTHKEVVSCSQVPDEVKEYFLGLLKEKEKGKCADITECFNEEEEVGVTSKKKGPMDGYVTKGKKTQLTLNEMVKKREPVIRDICRFFYKNAIAFNCVKCPTFKKMVASIGEYGRGLKPPTYHETRVSYLKKEVDLVNEGLEKYKKEWKKTGCTLMSDAWSDGRYRSITNFLVNSPSGTVFLKSIDTSGIFKNAEKLCELLDEMVNEIGEENVLQVVTDSASAYVSAGQLLMEKRTKLFWNPCAAHCLDLMLSDIGEFKVFKETLAKAKEITVLIYRHQWVLDMFRKYTKQRELARPAITRFATAYLTLKSMHDKKTQLRAMFRSKEWLASEHGRSTVGMRVKWIIETDATFWPSIKYCMHCVLPLVKVLRLVDGDAKPAMGYIYEAMDRAKEEIAKKFDNKKVRYDKIWNVIDTRWNYQLHRPLHAAAYFLNPKFQYGPNFNADQEVKHGLWTTIERMYPDLETRLTIHAQLEKFKNAEGMFGMEMAKATRDKTQPAIWWESFGEECKVLQTLAIRVLSGTCSATGCERNWSIFDVVHSKRRNRLETQRMNALVFVKYNIQLELRQEKRQRNGDAYDPICLSDMESDDEWITEKEDPVLHLDNSWMDIGECFKDDGTVGRKRKRGPRNINAYGQKKGRWKANERDYYDVEMLNDDEVIEVEDEEEEEEEEFDEETMVDDEEDDNVEELDLEDD